MATSDSKPNDQLIPLPESESEPESESQLSALIFDISQQAQGAMENMLRMISEIDQNAVGILEGIEKCRGSALDRKGVLEEEKQQFQQAAYTVLDMLNNRGLPLKRCKISLKNLCTFLPICIPFCVFTLSVISGFLIVENHKLSTKLRH